MIIAITLRDIIAIAVIILVILLLGGAHMLDAISGWRSRRRAAKQKRSQGRESPTQNS